MQLLTALSLLLLGVQTLLADRVEATSNTCHATPFVYANLCESQISLTGSTGYKITYSIQQAYNSGTVLCCQVHACGHINTSTSCSRFELYGIGCSTGSLLQATLPWGENTDFPAILCKGNPQGATLQWSHNII